MDTTSSTAAQRRAWNYWFEDGLPTLVGGFGCVVFGLSFIFDRPPLFRLLLAALYGVILLRNRTIIDWLKSQAYLSAHRIRNSALFSSRRAALTAGLSGTFPARRSGTAGKDSG